MIALGDRLDSWDTSALDAPAFPLNFDPAVLLAEAQSPGPDHEFHDWLNSELELDTLGGGPLASLLDEGHGAPANASASNQPLAAEPGPPVQPGIFELFQVHNLAPGGASMQQLPMQQIQQWSEQMPGMQQLQQQPTQLMQFTKPVQQQQQYMYQQQALQPSQQLQWQQMQPAMLPMSAGLSGPYPPFLQQQQQQPQQQLQYEVPLQMQLPSAQPQQLQQQFMYLDPNSQQSGMQQQQAATVATATGLTYLPHQQQFGSMHAAAPPAAAASGQSASAFMLPGGYLSAVQPVASMGMSAPDQQQPAATVELLQRRSSKASSSSAKAAATAPSRGRSKAATAAAAGEKPKGPSRRFRERQKETISNLEAEVTEKLAQLKALSAENEMLKLRSAVLEATVRGREYHMKVIKEHGPPVFDAAEAAQEALLSVSSSDYSASHSGISAGSTDRHAGNRSSSSGDEAEGTGTATDGETMAVNSNNGGGVPGAAGVPVRALSASSPARSGSSPKSGGSSHSAAAAVAAVVKPEPMDAATAAATASAAAAAAAAAAGSGNLTLLVQQGDSESLICCEAPQMCTPAQQKRTIRTLKHMSADDILKHWKQFLHDVTGELLRAEQQEEEAKLRKLAQFGSSRSAAAAAGLEEDTTEDGSCCTGAAAAVGKTCRWCSCEDNEEHSAEACEAQQQRDKQLQQQQQQQQEGGCSTAAGTWPGASGCGTAATGDGDAAAAAAAAGGSSSCTPQESRIVALVNKYSYMTKFVALLNPGVLYNVLGRHLDTGLSAPYSDDHWRQVVSRLGLSRHQVTVILACAELYFSSLSKLLDQRRVLQQQLKHADEGLSECNKRLAGVDGGLNQLQLLDALASNLKREHVLRIMLNCFVWGRSLNSIQFAKTAVYSHPFFPDVHAMVCVLYEDARAMAPNGEPARVFPHRPLQGPSAKEQQQQQSEQQQLQTLHEQLRAESDELRAEAERQRSGSGRSPMVLA